MRLCKGLTRHYCFVQVLRETIDGACPQKEEFNIVRCTGCALLNHNFHTSEYCLCAAPELLTYAPFHDVMSMLHVLLHHKRKQLQLHLLFL